MTEARAEDQYLVFYDFEFLEDGKTIDPISVGAIKVRKDTLEEVDSYYAVFLEAPWERIRKHEWLRREVVPHLPVHWDNKGPIFRPPARGGAVLATTSVIKGNLIYFILGKGPSIDYVDLWSDWPAYDHVALAQLYGPMVNLPEGFPMHTNSLVQATEELGLTPEDWPVRDTDRSHQALDDARYHLTVYRWLRHMKEIDDL